jgi:hypothetical protein
MERAARLQGLFYISLKFLIKIALNKEIIFLLSKALGEEHPSVFRQNRARMETDAHFQSLT